MNQSDSKTDLFLKIAKMYYIENMSQAEISIAINMSRSNISRILSKCIELGIVQININDELSEDPLGSAKLCQKFKLKNVFIAQVGRNNKSSLEKVSQLTAKYLAKTIESNMTVGISHGSHVFYTSRSLPHLIAHSNSIVQISGSISSAYLNIDSIHLVDIFSKKLNGSSFILPVPIMLYSKQIRNALLKEPVVSEVYEMYNKIDIALFDINRVQYLPPFINELPYLSKTDLLQLKEVEAVSELCGRFFDCNGIPCNTGIDDRIMAIPLPTIKKIPITIAMASGENMTQAVVSILRTNLINTLVIDESIAHQLKNSM